MKILQVIKNFPPAVGGSCKDAYLLCREMIRLGHNVTVVTTPSMTNKDIRGFSTGTQPFTWRNSCKPLPEHEVLDGIEVYRFMPIFRLWTYDINPRMFVFLSKHVKNFDIIHVHGYPHSEPSMVAVACKLWKKHFVITGHDFKTYERSFAIRSLKKIYDKTIGKALLVMCSKALARTIENAYDQLALGAPEEKIEIIPPGVDYDKFANTPASAQLTKELGAPERVILFVGRLLEYKGAQYIISAISNIIKDYPDTKFVFVGEDCGYKEQLIRLSKELGVLNHCIFTGRLPEKKLIGLYNIADVFVFPSSMEGFGMVALESISSGTPVILAKSGGLRHILKDIGGYPVDMSRDIPKQIACGVRNIFSDKDIESEIEEQKQRVRDFYTYKRIARATLKVYESVISER